MDTKGLVPLSLCNVVSGQRKGKKQIKKEKRKKGNCDCWYILVLQGTPGFVHAFFLFTTRQHNRKNPIRKKVKRNVYRFILAFWWVTWEQEPGNQRQLGHRLCLYSYEQAQVTSGNCCLSTVLTSSTPYIRSTEYRVQSRGGHRKIIQGSR